jgi:hypothetical protein
MLVVAEQAISHLLLELLELVAQILAEMVELLHHLSEHQETFILVQVVVVEREILLVVVNLEALVHLVLSLFVQLVVQMQMLQLLHPQVHGLLLLEQHQLNT